MGVLYHLPSARFPLKSKDRYGPLTNLMFEPFRNSLLQVELGVGPLSYIEALAFRISECETVSEDTEIVMVKWDHQGMLHSCKSGVLRKGADANRDISFSEFIIK